MSYTIITEMYFWLVCVVTGILMTFAYDCLILLRHIFRHSRLWVDIEDVIYWIISFFASFVVLYYENDGIIRFVAVLGAAVGMLIYRFTVGRFFVKTGLWIYDNIIVRLFRLLKRIKLGLHKRILCVNRIITKFFRRYVKKIIHGKYLLTRTLIDYKIKFNEKKQKNK